LRDTNVGGNTTKLLQNNYRQDNYRLREGFSSLHNDVNLTCIALKRLPLNLILICSISLTRSFSLPPSSGLC